MGNARTNHHNHPHSPPANTANMGRVRTKTVKKSAKVIIERYYPKLTLDFETNKRICDEIAIIASKRLRNKIAGYTTHLMRRIQRGPVRGISFKLQEEERERKDQYVPEISALDFAQLSDEGRLAAAAARAWSSPLQRPPLSDSRTDDGTTKIGVWGVYGANLCMLRLFTGFAFLTATYGPPGGISDWRQ